jgi:putative oxidoreductase
MYRALSYLTAPLGRLLLSAIFLMSGANKLMNWSQTADQMRGEGMVAVPFFLAGAVVFELGGGLSLLLGLKARLGALALVAFLVPVTLIFHDFWQYQDEAQMRQMIHFMKNSAILGGLLAVLTHGAGPVSVDAATAKSRTT